MGQYATVRALTLRQVPSTARATIDPAQAFWVMIGDAKVVRPQLDSRGLPVEVIPAASVATAR
ncbi:hypothetical protein [Sphingomonas sp. GC_Shp_3]|uniref:hypothetical protein n=1 Tax=Sphingomonas sp. GC_Shp_3 TaxID=2937383 RepID=UPI002269D006|nr:hypothetical protein [Sphingomonas sp. GC_Shp_3]